MRRLAFVFAFVSLFAARPAAADVELLLRVGSIWVTDPSFDLVAETDAIPNLQIGAGIEAAGPLTFELTYGLASSSAITFETFDASFTLHQFLGAARYDVPLSERWRAYGRGAAGVEIGVLRIDDVAGFDSVGALGDTALDLGLEGTLGIQLQLPISASDNRWAARLAFLMEAGYGWRPFAMSFSEADVSHDDDADPPPLRQGAIDVGELNLSGPILRFGASLYF